MSRPSNIAISPSSPDTIFMSANWANFLSTDTGRTWTESDRGADISCVQDIQFCAGKTYAVAMDEGLLVSEDNGAAWRQLVPRKYKLGLSGHQWRVLVTRQGEIERIVSTVSPWRGAEEYPNAVLVSSDGGKSFTQSHHGLPAYVPKVNCMWGQGYARALAADPTNSDVLYVGIDGDPEPGKGRSGGGVFKSMDGGRTWQQLPNQPGSRRMFFGLTVDPTEPRRVFWGACGEGGGVYRSEDAGATWQRTAAGETWVFNVTATPSGTVYCGGNNLWRSRDHGQTWKKLTNFKGFTVVGTAADPRDEQRVWISLVTWGNNAEGGIYRTTDGGATWQDISGDIGYRKPLVLRYNADTRELWAGGVGLFRTKQ
jgi:photosystem II stability/assembly factor-like uncharacterized protein